MIQASELRQNNFVLLSKDNFKTSKPYQLTSFDIYKADESDCADIRPIELSEEILLKCGFEKINVDGVYYKLNQIRIDNDFEPFVIDNQNYGWVTIGVKLNYLHQLQNLIHTLTQTELEINL